jgi:hypothetical protein
LAAGGAVRSPARAAAAGPELFSPEAASGLARKVDYMQTLCVLVIYNLIEFVHCTLKLPAHMQAAV